MGAESRWRPTLPPAPAFAPATCPPASLQALLLPAALCASQVYGILVPVHVSRPSSRLPPFPSLQTSLFSKAPGSGTHLRTGSQEAAGAGSFFKDTAARTKEGFAKIGNFIRVANALTGDHGAGGQGGEGSHH